MYLNHLDASNAKNLLIKTMRTILAMIGRLRTQNEKFLNTVHFDDNSAAGYCFAAAGFVCTVRFNKYYKGNQRKRTHTQKKNTLFKQQKQE